MVCSSRVALSAEFARAVRGLGRSARGLWDRLDVRRTPIGRQHMCPGKHLTGWLVRHRGERVGGCEGSAIASRRAGYRILEIRLDVGEGNRGGRRLAIVQGPLLRGVINLPQVIDAGVGLGLAARAHEAGNGNRGQHANNADHDHQFHQRKTRSLGRCHLHLSCLSTAGAPAGLALDSQVKALHLTSVPDGAG